MSQSGPHDEFPQPDRPEQAGPTGPPPSGPPPGQPPAGPLSQPGFQPSWAVPPPPQGPPPPGPPPGPPGPRGGRSQTMRWVIALGLALVLVAVILGGVVVAGRDDTEQDSSASGSSAASADPSPEPSAPDQPEGGYTTLDDYYAQELDWAPCDGGADLECAGLAVPLDYTDIGGDPVVLRLQRTLATSPDDRVGSLVVNPGGPGAPGTAMTENASSYFRPELLEAYDVVAFDPRGTGASDPVDCLSDSELDDYVAGDPTPDDADEIQDFEDAQDDFFTGCVDNSDELVGHVSTVEAARDMDVLRAALGEEQLDYLGFSYGTTLGSTYAELFPEQVGRFVLDGATDPTLDARQDALSQARGFERALRSYVGACVDRGGCFLGDTVDEAVGTVGDLLDSVDETPLPTRLDRDLEVGNAFYGVVAPLYQQEAWTQLDQALESALDGDGTLLLAFSDLYTSRDTMSGAYTDNSFEAFPSISCLDDPTAIDPADVPAQYPDFEAASPTFGRSFAWGLAGCDGIQVEATEPTPTIRAEGAAPIVVLGTTRDPATPYEEAVALAGQLESGVLVSRDGDGHTAYNKGNDCIDETVESYLIDGEVPEDGTQC